MHDALSTAPDVELSSPRFVHEAEAFARDMAKYSAETIAEMLSCSRQIAEQNKLRFMRFFEGTAKLPAILAYHGQAYKHLKAETLTADDLWDAHYRIGYRSGLNTGDRARTLDYVRKIHKKTAYERRLQVICRSSLLYKLYLSYRKKHLKKSRLDMYFGN